MRSWLGVQGHARRWLLGFSMAGLLMPDTGKSST